MSSRSDPSLFVSGSAPHATCLLCYVDDLLIAGKRTEVERTKQAIVKRFKCDDMGQANLFLGMKISETAEGITVDRAITLRSGDP